jgi:N6-adenosine-specific RNA methylase IME4
MTQPTKVCSRCHQSKPLDQFKADSRVKSDGRAAYCKACNRSVGFVAPNHQLAELGLYDQARALLAKAKAVDEVKAIGDRAAMFREYAKRAKDRSGLIDMAEIMIRAEARMGEMIIAQKETVGLNAGTRGQLRGRTSSGTTETEAPEDTRPKLADVGIDHKMSSHAQKLAALSNLEERLIAWREEVSAPKARVTMDLLKINQEQDKAERRATRERVLGGIQLALPDKKYGVILADPEWRFEPYSRETGMDRAADNHYPTSSTEAICARPVADIAANDCILFLWATVPMLPDALAVMKAWGFEYKSQFVWVKDRLGTGYWNRNQHELLLIGARGNPPAPAPGTRERSVIEAPVRDHSRKPDIVYDYIEGWYPTLPKIELNARSARDGWDRWGNESPEPDATPAGAVVANASGVTAGETASAGLPSAQCLTSAGCEDADESQQRSRDFSHKDEAA